MFVTIGERQGARYNVPLDVGLVSGEGRHLHVNVLERDGGDGVHTVDVVVRYRRHDVFRRFSGGHQMLN